MTTFRRTGPAPTWAPSPELVERLALETTQVWAAPGTTDLGIGQPDETLLPLDLFRRALTSTSIATADPLQYGGPLGDGFLRLALAEFLTTAYGVETDAGTMLISNGNSQAIDLVCATLTRPGDVVFVEEPTYFLALEIFRSHGVRLVGIPVDDGMSIDALETALATYRPALVYTIPTFHNPMGVTMTAERRERLIELAEEHEFLVLADEVYHLLDFPGTAAVPLPLAAAVHTGVVISLGTFSKILAPGLRLGWVQTAPAVLARLAEAPVITSGGGLNPFVSTIVRSMLEHGWLGDHLASVQGRLAARAAVMDDALRVHFPAATEIARPAGGYFVWLRFPGETDTARWWGAAAEQQVGYRPGELFSTRGGQTDRMRLSFAFYESDRIEQAVATLGRIVTGRTVTGDIVT